MRIKDRQAVALHITGDRSVLANVRCLANQDTLWLVRSQKLPGGIIIQK